MFEYEYAIRNWLFILLITLEGNVLSELESSDHMRMMQSLESDPLVFEVFLLLTGSCRDNFKDDRMI